LRWVRVWEDGLLIGSLVGFGGRGGGELSLGTRDYEGRGGEIARSRGLGRRVVM